jgi:hypothetical protein
MANSSVCLTPACLQAATTLVWQLAPNWDKMDPCTEFDKSEYLTFPSWIETNRRTPPVENRELT